MSSQSAKPAVSPVLVDVQEVANLLRCSDRHVFRLAEIGRMPKPVKLGSLVRWNRLAIDKWIEDGCPALEPRDEKKP